MRIGEVAKVMLHLYTLYTSEHRGRGRVGARVSLHLGKLLRNFLFSWS